MNNAVGSSHSVLLKQRTFRSEYQEAKQEHGEAKKYDLLLEDLVCCLTLTHLFSTSVSISRVIGVKHVNYFIAEQK